MSVFAFDDPIPAGVAPASILGGKGAGLVEMSQGLGLPVPPGFVITTDVCRSYLDAGWPESLDAELKEHLERLGAQLARRFGDDEFPLLVSVRSGAAISMPGMMDTLLNVGITPAIRERLADLTSNPRFAADAWLRFCRMYAEIVLGVDKAEIASAAASDGTPSGLLAAAERVMALAKANGSAIPDEPMEQLRGAVEAVFSSWNSERAVVFRAKEGIPEDLGTAVTVQAMVFGNLDELSGTGVAFTRDPATGDPHPLGDYLPRAQGEDVVAGTHAVGNLETLNGQLPLVHDELMGVLSRLEHHYQDMCDVEFTISEARLFILQTRVGRRSPLAAARIAVAMAEDPDFPLTRAEAVARVDQQTLQQIASAGRIAENATPISSGLAASPGVGVGVLTCDPDRAADLASKGTATVLARAETSPADIHGMVGASGLVTTLGGMASHAAVVARSWTIPAVTSLSDAEFVDGGLRVAGTFISEGEIVTVDGQTGAFYLGDCRAGDADDVAEARTLRRWASELGVDPGTTAGTITEPERGADITLLELVRTVQLKGLCTPERAAAALFTTPTRIEQLAQRNMHLFRETPRGFVLTAEGRDWVIESIASEAKSVKAEAFDDCYVRFLPLNVRLKQVVSTWQTVSKADEREQAWSNVISSLEQLQDNLRPLLEEAAGHVERLRPYKRRLEHALEAMRRGDESMLASPLKESYHTIWFEYHEELIALSGRDRATEETG